MPGCGDEQVRCPKRTAVPAQSGDGGRQRIAAEEETTVNRRTNDDGSSALQKGFDAIARQNWFVAEEVFPPEIVVGRVRVELIGKSIRSCVVGDCPSSVPLI